MATQSIAIRILNSTESFEFLSARLRPDDVIGSLDLPEAVNDLYQFLSTESLFAPEPSARSTVIPISAQQGRLIANQFI